RGNVQKFERPRRGEIPQLYARVDMRFIAQGEELAVAAELGVTARNPRAAAEYRLEGKLQVPAHAAIDANLTASFVDPHAAFQPVVEIEYRSPSGQPVPFLGDSQIGRRQAGNRFGLQLAKAVLRHSGLPGDFPGFVDHVERQDDVARPTAMTSGLGL